MYAGLYFGSCSGWCDACNNFTPLLEQAYVDTHRSGTKPSLEVVYISHDRNQQEWAKSLEGLPWKAMLWGEHTRRQNLVDTFHVSAIPTLVILKPNGTILTTGERLGLLV